MCCSSATCSRPQRHWLMSAPSRLHQLGEALVERAPERRAAVRVGLVRRVAPFGMLVEQRNQRLGGERPFLAQRQAGLLDQHDAVQRADEGGEDQRLGPVLVHHPVPAAEQRQRLPRALVARRDRLRNGSRSPAAERRGGRPASPPTVSRLCLSIGVEELLDAAGAESLFPIAGRIRLPGRGRRSALLALKTKPAVGIVELRQPGRRASTPIQSNAPEAPSTGASPSPDLRSRHAGRG